MHRLSILAAACALLGCASSAPHTLASAAINTALAAGASAAQVSAGGCYAVCTHGTVCNPRTGFCEREVQPCAPGSGADPRCGAPASTWGVEQGVRPLPTDVLPPGLGVSPQTGRAPPAAGERPTEDRP